jgi:hypothetical protein
VSPDLFPALSCCLHPTAPYSALAKMSAAPTDPCCCCCCCCLPQQRPTLRWPRSLCASGWQAMALTQRSRCCGATCQHSSPSQPRSKVRQTGRHTRTSAAAAAAAAAVAAVATAAAVTPLLVRACCARLLLFAECSLSRGCKKMHASHSYHPHTAV